MSHSPRPSPSNADRVRAIWPYFDGTRRAFVLAGVAALVGSATEPLVPALLKQLLDNGFTRGKLALWMVPVAIIGLFLIRGLAGFLASYALSWAANQGTLKMRSAMFGRLFDAHPALFTRQSASSLINTVVYEVQAGTGLLVSAVQTLVKDSLTAVALLVYLVWVNWQLTLFIGALLPAVAFTMRVFGKRMHRVTLEGQKATDELAYVVEENVLAWRIVRLHGAAAAEWTRFNRASAALRRLVLKATVAASAVTPITQLLSAIALSAVIVVALWQREHQGGTVGTFVSFVTAMLMLVSPLKHLSEVAGPITRGLASVQRGIALVNETPVETGGHYRTERAKGTLSLQQVSLHYHDDQPPALDSVSIQIEPGETIALVGPSGAGKSTLINLLPRFLDRTSGEIYLDGVALADWDLVSLRSQFALVSQDVVLFNDTIAANVALGGVFDRDRVLAALEGANLLEFVNGLPKGIDNHVGHNGSHLSGGQRQRLAIARAIYKDAPILFLDEATSALDSESERLVQNALEKLMAGRTSIVIAHRLSTVEAADRVIVLDHGRVVDQGTHEELLGRKGLFSRLHALQFNA